MLRYRFDDAPGAMHLSISLPAVPRPGDLVAWKDDQEGLVVRSVTFSATEVTLTVEESLSRFGGDHGVLIALGWKEHPL
ncbi:MAG: hypothetical protein AB7O67_23495 [Vicinamibacterales bacterium]